MSDEEIAHEALLAWKADPACMVYDLFEHTVADDWQRRGLEAWASGKPRERIAFQACAGPGKSCELAWMGWNALLCHSDGQHDHPQGAAVSITGDNLKNNLWKELAYWRSRSPVLQKAFDMTSERIFARESPATWFLSARSFSKSADPETQGATLSGLHAKRIFYLVDESGDMPPAVLRKAEQGLSNCQWGRIAQAGNPTNLQGALYQAANEQSHLWTVIRITGDPDDAGRSGRIDAEWAREQIALYGRDDAWVMAFVLGKFPPNSLNTLLGPDEIRASMARHVPEDQYTYAQKRLGIDVARFGGDRTVIFPRQGLMAFEPVEMRGARTHEIAARIALAKSTWGSEMELIDDTGGWAAGVTDSCLLGGIGLVPVNFSSGATDPRYFNKRSEIHFLAAEWVKQRGGALPDVRDLVREGSAPMYWFDNGKLRVTEKDQVKKQLNGHSPDYWDAFICTFAVAEMPAGVGALTGGAHGAGKLLSDYDPFDPARW